MRRWLLGLMLGLLPLMAQAGVTAYFGVVALRGPIKPGDHTALVKALDEKQPARLVLRGRLSGSVTEATLIGEELARRGLPLRIDGQCLSPCAERIALRAPALEFDGGGIAFLPTLALPDSLRIHVRQLRVNGSLDDEAAAAQLRQLDAQGGPLDDLAALLTPPQAAVLDFARRLLTPTMSGMELAEAGSGEKSKLSMQLRCLAWIPNSATLIALGVRVKGEARDIADRQSKYPEHLSYRGPWLPPGQESLACQGPSAPA